MVGGSTHFGEGATLIAAKHIGECENLIRGQLTKSEAVVATMMGTWKGDDARMFADYHQRFQQAVEKVLREFEDMRGKLKIADDLVTAQKETNKEEVRKAYPDL